MTTKPRLTLEEFVQRKQQLAGEPGTYVVKSNTLESKYMLVRLREYDRLLSWVKMHIGVDIDTEEALALIEQCKNVERQFGEALNALKKFVPERKRDNNGDNKKEEKPLPPNMT